MNEIHTNQLGKRENGTHRQDLDLLMRLIITKVQLIVSVNKHIK